MIQDIMDCLGWLAKEQGWMTNYQEGCVTWFMPNNPGWYVDIRSHQVTVARSSEVFHWPASTIPQAVGLAIISREAILQAHAWTQITQPA